ncbi:MAG: methyltransferase family protein [Alphaproteobacteria bacterium]
MSERHANALVRPPILYLGGLVTGCLLELLLPLGPGLAGGAARAVWTGLAIAAIGIAIAVKAMRLFNDAGTSLPVHTPTDALVTEGLYSWSRNPIYIALSLFYVGLSIALTTGWALLLLPVVIAALQKGVILREEAYLAEEFGEEYLAYKKRVPRWL